MITKGVTEFQIIMHEIIEKGLKEIFTNIDVGTICGIDKREHDKN